VIRWEYRGVAVAQKIPVLVYLPPCFEAQPQPVPAIYLLHGYPFDENHWLSLGAAEIADELIGSGQRLPFVMVMPRQPEPLFRSSDGGPGSYETELLEGLLPSIEWTYPVQTRLGSRALAGISRGGVWALEIGLRNPEVFSSVGALSPALAVNHPRPPYDPFEIARQATQRPALLLLLAGDQDWAAGQTLKLSALLEDLGWPHQWLQVPGDHSAPTWETAMRPALEYLTSGWSPPPP
jgi:enterochelin esterase-like enzyme